MNDVWQVNGFNCLEKLSQAECQELKSASHRRHFGRGDVVFSPSSHPSSVYLLEGGLVRILRLSESGDEMTLGYIAPGEVFGELAALGELDRESHAVAVKASTVWTVPIELFERLIECQPGRILSVTKQIGGRLRRIESRLEDLVFRNVFDRVVDVLASHNGEIGPEDTEKEDGHFLLTQSELATLVGASRQSVNEVVKKLERKGLVRLGRGRIDVLRASALCAESSEFHTGIGG